MPLRYPPMYYEKLFLIVAEGRQEMTHFAMARQIYSEHVHPVCEFGISCHMFIEFH